jgi:hypothetical protein
MKPGTLCQLIISRDGRKIDAFAAGETKRSTSQPVAPQPAFLCPHERDQLRDTSDTAMPFAPLWTQTLITFVK